MCPPAAAPVYRLIYVSHIEGQAALQLDETMQAILLTFHRRNLEAGVTGLLLSNGFWFVQALEGEEAAVEDCYARILADPRHKGATIRSRGLVEKRAFERWSMCGATLSRLEDALLPPPDIEFDVWTVRPGALLQLLTTVAEAHGAQLDALHADLGAQLARPLRGGLEQGER